MAEDATAEIPLHSINYSVKKYLHFNTTSYICLHDIFLFYVQ